MITYPINTESTASWPLPSMGYVWAEQTWSRSTPSVAHASASYGCRTLVLQVSATLCGISPRIREKSLQRCDHEWVPSKGGEFSVRTETHVYTPHGLIFINNCGMGTFQSCSSCGALVAPLRVNTATFLKGRCGKGLILAKPSQPATDKRKKKEGRLFERR